MNFYKHHLGDYDGATSHLSWDEDMAYTRLLRAYYRQERPIPCEQAYRLSRASSKAQRAAVDTVLGEFFSRDGDVWRNKRADEEIAAYQAQADTNRRIANNRKGKRNDNEPSHESLHEPSTNHTPNQNQIPEPDTRKELKTSADAPDWLPTEWRDYERHRAEKRSKFTPTARRLCIEKLEVWKSEGRDIAAILRHNISNGYTGLFLPNEGGNGATRRSGVTAGNIAAAQEFVRRGQVEDV